MLQGKVAWITGAGSGIGRAGALELAAGGAQVILSGRRAEQLKESRRRRSRPPAARPKRRRSMSPTRPRWQRSAPASSSATAASTSSSTAPGINLLDAASGRDLTPDSFDQIVGINLNGALYCIHAVLPAMRARKDGLVINVSSWAGRFETISSARPTTRARPRMVALTMSLNDEECVNGIRALRHLSGRGGDADLASTARSRRRQEEIARMLQPEDLGKTIRFVAEMPPRVCINEILITPDLEPLLHRRQGHGPRSESADATRDGSPRPDVRPGDDGDTVVAAPVAAPAAWSIDGCRCDDAEVATSSLPRKAAAARLAS